MKSVLESIVAGVELGWHFRNSAIFVALQLLTASVFFVSVSSFDLWLFLGSSYLGILSISIGYHRLVSHNSYGANRWFVRLPLVIVACTTVQKGPLWWAWSHICHHRRADQDGDPHSPVRKGSFWSWAVGFFWAQGGWLFWPRKGEYDFPKNWRLAKNWEMRLMDKLHFVPPILLAYVCWELNGLSGLVWGFVARTFFVFHLTSWVNSVCHTPYMLGWRRSKKDHSRDNPVVALFTLGEGWHGTHHLYPNHAAQGDRWWKLDISYLVLKFFEVVSAGMLVWGVDKPRREIGEEVVSQTQSGVENEFEPEFVAVGSELTV